MFNKFSAKPSNPESFLDTGTRARLVPGQPSDTPAQPMADNSMHSGASQPFSSAAERHHADRSVERSSRYASTSMGDQDTKASKMASPDKSGDRQLTSSGREAKPSRKEGRADTTMLPEVTQAGAIQGSASDGASDVKIIRIVILGAGYAGVSTALALDRIMSSDGFLGFDSGKSLWSAWFGSSCGSRENKSLSAPKIKYEVVLISQMNAMHHNVASLRGLIQPSIGQALFIPLTHLFDGSDKLNAKTHAPSSSAALYEGRFIQGSVSDVTMSCVTYVGEAGKAEKLDFDFLVIALGSSYASPMKTEKRTVPEAVDELRDYAERFKSARSVLIVGGGPVGVELAGEIAADYPEKKVTLVHAGEALVDNGGVPRLQAGLLESLKSKGVEVLLGHRVTSNAGTGFGNKTITTDKGASIESDAQFLCAGAVPNTSVLKSLASGVNSEMLDMAGRVKVNSYLQVENLDHIFALGDVCNTEEAKLGYLAGLHGSVAADNVSKLAKYAAERHRMANKASTETAQRPLPSRKNSLDTSIDARSMEEKEEAQAEVTRPTLMAYKRPSMKLMSVSVGRSGGRTQLSETLVFGDFVTRLLKAKDLFLSKYWSELRAGKVPGDSS